MTWFRAALEARYEYHPPSELSDMEPTRADIAAQVAWVGERPL